MFHSDFWSNLATTLAATSTAMAPRIIPAAGAAPANDTLGRHDFDFLHGKWHVKNRRLAARLEHSDDWVEFDAATEVTPLPGGLGHIDVYRTQHWRGFVGITLRIYDPRTRQWSLLWVDNHDAPGVLQPPVVGAFDGNVGVFTAADTYRGRPILVRLVWTVLGADTARWEQAYSADDGNDWETNWIMELSRICGYHNRPRVGGRLSRPG